MPATAFWVDGPSQGSLREVALSEPRSGDAVVRTLVTGISRGTESIVFRGEVPATERDRMRAPFQAGDLPGPVVYGYLNVGVVESGPAGLAGRTVFTLFPHQSRFVVPASEVSVVPDAVPPRRAVLAGAVETAVNILWDAAPLVGDRVSVVGAGMIGCAVARLAAGIPGADVVLVDVDPAKAEVAEGLGVAFAPPDGAPSDRDLVIHTSGSGEGLQLAIDSVATEGEVIEASWFGDRPVSLHLGGAFHSRRLTLRSSQVGMVSPRRRGTRTTRDRLAFALELLRDPVFDLLLTGESSWRELPTVMAAISDGSAPGLCHTIDWSDA
ncbi:zinc-dependent alcohol dehydrogenase [Microbacterium sp. SSM24]|uniref:zinc-dependent alcohol dehydrogenase n=1 Tax=Microbacterium sp. SSM24 TaxID=2991714 RepID=UPI002226CF3F|nr:zinc-binding alcohol dehydrogenase [Microbacterium sp. SSM24]MCW3493137.1 zinc-binding alcohol dehydrogenase [Microbacterium sp. SSM24]